MLENEIEVFRGIEGILQHKREGGGGSERDGNLGFRTFTQPCMSNLAQAEF